MIKPMTRHVIARHTRFAVAALAVVVGVSGTLAACASGGTPVTRVFGGLASPAISPETEAARDLEEFHKVYVNYAIDDADRQRQFRHFTDAYARVRRDYVQHVEDGFLIDAALEGVRKLDGEPGKMPSRKVVEAALDSMLASLDPHSSYLNPDEFKDSQVATTGEFGGLGIEINMEEGLVKVIAPIEDTPAYRAGLKAGDLITRVGDKSIEGMSLVEAVKELRGPPNSDVRLTIRRPGIGEFEVTITRSIIRIRPVKWRTEDNIGVIRITSFISRADDELTSAIAELRREKGSLKGLVIDLRNNPGGLLNQSVAVADAFIHKGDIVSVRDRDGHGRSYDAALGDLANGMPVVVLINRGSASAAEIVAGALQDHGRVTVLGERSFGKGSVQTITPLEWDGALRLTTALYYLPSGRSIQGSGVEPDIVIAGEEAVEQRREADLPHALKVQPGTGKRARAKIRESECPTAGAENDDRILGCAVMFLKDGSESKFLARFGTSTNL